MRRRPVKSSGTGIGRGVGLYPNPSSPTINPAVGFGGSSRLSFSPKTPFHPKRLFHLHHLSIHITGGATSSIPIRDTFARTPDGLQILVSIATPT